MMKINQRKVKLANEDTTTRRKPDSTSGIYLTTIKVSQCRQGAENRRKKEEAKKVTEKKAYTRKVHIQLKRPEDFYTCINYMDSLYSSTTNEERLIQIIQQSSNNIGMPFPPMCKKASLMVLDDC